MNWTRSCLLTLLIIAFTAGPLYAQENDDDSIREGRTALSFSFDGFDLGFFQGGVGGKYWLGPQTALRGSISIDLGFDEDADDRRHYESTRLGLGVDLGVERHFATGRRVSPYVGAIVGASAGWSTRESSSRRDTFLVSSERQSTSMSGRVDAILGVEYFLMPHVSLAGEYAVGVRLGRRHSEGEHIPPDGPVERFEHSDTFFDLTSRSPSLILSIYF